MRLNMVVLFLGINNLGKMKMKKVGKHFVMPGF